MADIPLILLAAGNSARMGQSKQLLPWGAETLIEHQIQTLLETGMPVIVVLGAYADRIVPLVKKFKVNTVINSQWEDGMGSSIATGIKRLIETYPNSKGALIILLDQPLVTSLHLKKMLEGFEAGHQQILASKAPSGWSGVPVLFDQDYFEELHDLKGNTGAKTILQQHLDAVIEIESGDILEDIDTPDRYLQLKEKFFE